MMNTKPIRTLHIALASFIGTAIEFYDFYIYAMASALVIGPVFFPSDDPAAQSLNAFLTFGIAFLARPVGAIVFGHFGDKVGRKTTLALSLLVMGLATLMIGLLPGYATIGIWAPIVLCVLRFCQGLGLGGEWGGAALLATEHAPEGKRGWFGMFPQLGPSVGFLLATLSFLGLSWGLTDAQFQDWGWRLPFVASSLLVAVGLYVRFQLAETPAFVNALETQATQRLPIRHLLVRQWRPVILGAFAMVVCYQLFYTATVFCLSYGTQQLGIPRVEFLGMLCVAVLFMTLATPISAALSDTFGRHKILLFSTSLAVLVGCLLAPLMQSHSIFGITFFLSLALFAMGACFAPMGAFLPEQFSVDVRYTGAGLAYQLGGILGGSMSPFIAQKLVVAGGLSWVGGYLSLASLVSFFAVIIIQWHLSAISLK